MSKRKTVVIEHGADFKVDVDETEIKAQHTATHLAEEIYGKDCLSDSDEITVAVTDSQPKQTPFPRLYVLIDKDMAPVTTPHLRERDAYTEKESFADAHITTQVVIYEPLLGKRR